jgi:hypothetical protein
LLGESGSVARHGGRIDAALELEYRRANTVDRPTGDHQADLVREMRRWRIDGEVLEQLFDVVDGIAMYQEAVRLGDTERTDVLARLAPRWLDSVRRRELAKPVDEQTPPKVKDAREKLAKLEQEKEEPPCGALPAGYPDLSKTPEGGGADDRKARTGIASVPVQPRPGFPDVVIHARGECTRRSAE